MSRNDIEGTDGNDNLVGTGGEDEIRGREGNDRLVGGAGDDRLRGDKGDDRLLGGNGNDELRGDEGNDTLLGGAGDDRLRGDKGDDRLTGDEGRDRFIFNRQGGDDVVTDFTDGEDRLDFSNFDFASVDALLKEAEQDGDNVVFTLDTGETVTLLDVGKASLGAGDFII